MKTGELLERLQRHYIKPGAVPAGGIFLPEVGWNGGGTSRADALFIGFTGTSGQMLVGHELKVSRSDWLAELSSPGKADQWAENCHEWWVVTIPGVVHEGELPPGWGLMTPGRSKTRMQIVKPAPRYLDRQPSWDATRSIMARLDTLQSARLDSVRSEARRTAQDSIDERVDLALAARVRHDPDMDALRALLGQYEAALGPLGVRTLPWAPDAKPLVTPEELEDVATLLATRKMLYEASDALASRWHQNVLDSIVKDATELRALLTKTAPMNLPF